MIDIFISIRIKICKIYSRKTAAPLKIYILANCTATVFVLH